MNRYNYPRPQLGYGRPERIRIEDRVPGGKYWVLAHPPRLVAQVERGIYSGYSRKWGTVRRARETRTGRGSPMKGHQRSLGADARFHGQHLGVHSSGARRLAAYHDDRRRLTVTEAVLTVNARYRGPKEKTAETSRQRL